MKRVFLTYVLFVATEALGSVGSVGSVGSTGGSSWPSSTPEAWPSPASTPTSHDAVDAEADADAEPPFTLGATEHTPYKCKFCDKAFPRLSYLKKHEQVGYLTLYGVHRIYIYKDQADRVAVYWCQKCLV